MICAPRREQEKDLPVPFKRLGRALRTWSCLAEERVFPPGGGSALPAQLGCREGSPEGFFLRQDLLLTPDTQAWCQSGNKHGTFPLQAHGICAHERVLARLVGEQMLSSSRHDQRLQWQGGLIIRSTWLVNSRLLGK